MAKRKAISFKEVKPIIVGPIGKYEAARVQRLDIPTNLPTTDIDELGNPYHAGTVTDIPEVTMTFQAMDVSVKLFAALTGTNPAAYPPTGVDVSKIGYIDLIADIADEDMADIAKSLICREAKVTGFTYTYSVDGEATEEYTAQGSDKRWFRYNIVVDKFTTPGTGPFTLSQTPIRLKSGNYVISVIADGQYLTEVSGTPAAGQYSYSAGAITLGSAISQQVVAVYHAQVAGDNWTNILDNTIPAAVRGKNIPVKIAANNIPRVQSVTIRGTFPTTTIREMGTPTIVGYVTGPTNVEGDISVNDTDTELIALFTTGSLNPADTEFQVCEMTASGISLEINIYDPLTSCSLPLASGTILKTIYIPSLTITSEGHTTNVGGQAVQTFGFRSTTGACIIYSGARS